MEKFDTKTTVEFIKALKNINKEIQINSFFNFLLLKIEGKEYGIDGLPKELIEELNNFKIPKNWFVLFFINFLKWTHAPEYKQRK